MTPKSSSQDSVVFPQEKRQRNLLIILVVLVLSALIILYFGFWRSKPSPSSIVLSSSEAAAPGIATIEDIIKKIDFDIDFLENSLFQNLKIYGEWPLEIEEKGRTNPFSSF